MSIAERIKRARKEAGLTQAQLAKKVGLSREAVSQWESGDTKGIRPENLFAAADALQISPRWLATGKGHYKIDIPKHETMDTELLEKCLIEIHKELKATKADLSRLTHKKHANLIGLYYNRFKESGHITKEEKKAWLSLVA